MSELIYVNNSLSRKKEEFVPLNPPQVKMYVCGPTVYDEPHIGHARSAYIFDVIRRYLAYKQYKLTFVRNVTDVDDKIIEKAKKEYPGEDLNGAVEKVSVKYLDSYHQAMDLLGILQPDFEPKATEYLTSDNPAMQNFIVELINRGSAYASGGDVYFDIKKANDYGKLSHQALDKMESGARIASGGKKRDPLDFALWKSAKEGEPSWDSPWGKGRPGWHIECSVMSSDILGDEFDIHGGGIDLIFPHHENEIAQSEGAGKKFARYWIHHGLLTINGQKMAKSLGNFVTIKDFLDKYKYADLLKLFFLVAHYSHPVDYTENKIEECKEAMDRVYIFFDKLNQYKDSIAKTELATFSSFKDKIESIKLEFINAMDDDFNTPIALSKLFEIIYEANVNLHNNDLDINGVKLAVQTVKDLGAILGLSFKFDKFAGTKSVGITSDIYFRDISDEEIKRKLAERNEARKNKNYALSDAIRDELEKYGIILEDAKDGRATWRRKL